MPGGLILAGGRSSRMGEPKCLIKVGGLRLIDWVADAMRARLDEDLIVVGGNVSPLPGGFREVADLAPGAGPAAGLYAGLSACQSEYVFATACDLPMLSPEVIRGLLLLMPGFDVVVPEIRGFLEPLCAVYKTSVVTPLKQILDSGERRIQALYAQVRTRVVPEVTVRQFDPGLNSFLNVNTRDDLARVTPLLLEKTREN
jgi:molybdopterin-guanine dinucleotide biosynthesis protein A